MVWVLGDSRDCGTVVAVPIAQATCYCCPVGVATKDDTVGDFGAFKAIRPR